MDGFPSFKSSLENIKHKSELQHRFL